MPTGPRKPPPAPLERVPLEPGPTAHFLRGRLNPREAALLDYVHTLLGPAKHVAPRVRAGDVPTAFGDQKYLGRFTYTLMDGGLSGAPAIRRPGHEESGQIQLFGDRVQGRQPIDSAAVLSHELGHWFDYLSKRRQLGSDPTSKPFAHEDDETLADKYGYVLSRMALDQPVDSVFNPHVKRIQTTLDWLKSVVGSPAVPAHYEPWKP